MSVPNSSVRLYLSTIGRKGGQKKSPAKRKAARKAAQARWRKEHPAPKKVKIPC